MVSPLFVDGPGWKFETYLWLLLGPPVGVYALWFLQKLLRVIAAVVSHLRNREERGQCCPPEREIDKKPWWATKRWGHLGKTILLPFYFVAAPQIVIQYALLDADYIVGRNFGGCPSGADCFTLGRPSQETFYFGLPTSGLDGVAAVDCQSSNLTLPSDMQLVCYTVLQQTLTNYVEVVGIISGAAQVMAYVAIMIANYTKVSYYTRGERGDGGDGNKCDVDFKRNTKFAYAMYFVCGIVTALIATFNHSKVQEAIFGSMQYSVYPANDALVVLGAAIGLVIAANQVHNFNNEDTLDKRRDKHKRHWETHRTAYAPVISCRSRFCEPGSHCCCEEVSKEEFDIQKKNIETKWDISKNFGDHPWAFAYEEGLGRPDIRADKIEARITAVNREHWENHKHATDEITAMHRDITAMHRKIHNRYAGVADVSQAVRDVHRAQVKFTKSSRQRQLPESSSVTIKEPVKVSPTVLPSIAADPLNEDNVLQIHGQVLGTYTI